MFFFHFSIPLFGRATNQFNIETPEIKRVRKGERGEKERERECMRERREGINCQIEELKTLSRVQVLHGVNCLRCIN